MDEVVYGPDGLIPAVAQDRRSGQVLMVAYMTPEALRRTLAEGRAWYWSRSRQALWRKGEQSGHTQAVREVRLDCDGDALLLLVDQEGPACHTGRPSCFFRGPEGRELPDPPRGGDDVLDELSALVRSRRLAAPAGSYTAALFAAGRAAIGAKVREEAEELARAALDESGRRVVEEAADLLYHTLVLLADRGLSLDDVRLELARRRGR